MVEYAIILTLISLVSILLLIVVGNRISNWFSNVSVALGG
jgi:Flp pilus assembly pilin Flp